jgi:hypothetical protein
VGEPVSRLLRDIRLSSIGGGADEVMLGIISKYMGTLPTLMRDFHPLSPVGRGLGRGAIAPSTLSPSLSQMEEP